MNLVLAPVCGLATLFVRTSVHVAKQTCSHMLCATAQGKRDSAHSATMREASQVCARPMCGVCSGVYVCVCDVHEFCENKLGHAMRYIADTQGMQPVRLDGFIWVHM